MASQKKERIERVREAHKAFMKVSEEVGNLTLLETLATESGNDRVIEMFKATKARYDEDYKYLAQKRMYHVQKLIEEKPEMFNEILNKILA